MSIEIFGLIGFGEAFPELQNDICKPANLFWDIDELWWMEDAVPPF